MRRAGAALALARGALQLARSPAGPAVSPGNAARATLLRSLLPCRAWSGAARYSSSAAASGALARSAIISAAVVFAL